MPLRSSALPARGSAVAGTSRGTASRADQTFEPEMQETPLNGGALVALENLRRTASSNNTANSLDATLKRAAELLTDVLQQVNDRKTEETTRRDNRLEKIQSRGEEEDPSQRQQYEDFQHRVEEINNKLDGSMRQVVDDQVWSEAVPNSLKHVVDKCKDISARADPQNTLVDEDGNEVEDDSDIVVQNVQPSAADNPSAILQAAQSTTETSWNSQTLTERYSRNETYKSFYKMRWDVQHPQDNPPPLPHPSLWFAAEEGRPSKKTGLSRQRSTQQSSGADNDEDTSMNGGFEEDTEIQIHSENVSCKCPLTLRWFEEPVTSTKCPHSFEKSAIVDFIRSSSERVPLSDEQQADLNERYPRGTRGRPQAEAHMKASNPTFAACPVCAMQLTEKDVRDDPVLLRKTKRAKEAQEAEERAEAVDDDDEDSEDDLMRGTQRRRARRRSVAHVTSSPATERRRTLIKSEREATIVPDSQRPARSTQRSRRRVLDLDDDDEGDETEDNDTQMTG